MSLPPEEIAYQEANITQNQGPTVVGVNAFLIAITTVIVGVRLIAKLVRRLTFGFDDILVTVAYALTVCMCVINIIGVHYGLGQHLLAINPATSYQILHVAWFLSLSYSITQWCIKMSIILTYIRVFTLNMLWFRYAIYFMIFYISSWAIGCILLVLTECRPISHFWEQYNITAMPPAEGICSANNTAAEISTAALNLAADIILLILPLTVLSRLQLSTKKKFGVMSIFAVGAFACVAGILRLTTTVASLSPLDPSWVATPVFIWTSVEAAVGLLCACFPVIGPLLPIATDKLRSLTGGMTGNSRSRLYDSKASRPRRDDYQMQSSDKQSLTKSNGSMTGNGKLSSVDIEATELPNGRVLRTDSYEVVSVAR